MNSRIFKRINTTVAAAVLIAVLSACTGSEERQAEYLARAQEHFDAGNYDKAGVDVRNALQINGNNVDARYLYALLFEKQDNLREMLANLRFVIDLAPEHIPARIKLGTVLVAAQMTDEALAQADAVLALEPEHAEAYALKSAAYFRSGDTDLAIAAAQTALGFEPGNLSAVAVLTQIYKTENPALALDFIRQGIEAQDELAVLKLLEISVYEANDDIDAASRLYKSLTNAYPENLYYYYRYVSMLQANDRVDEAEALLRDIVRTRPGEVELKLWLAQYLANSRDLPAAEASLREFIARDPTQSELQVALAEVLIAQRKSDQARDVYQSLVDRDPQSELAQRARNGLVRLDLAAGNRAEADARLAEILEIEPENPDALLIRARLALLAGNLDAAIGGTRSVLRNQPESVPALETLAQAHARLGSHELALDTYRQILTLNPGHAPALTALTLAALEDDDPKLAEKLALAAMRADPGNTEPARLLVAAYARQNNLEQAIAEAERLAGSERGRALGSYLLGRIYQSTGDYPAAAEKFAQTLTLEPGAIEALEALVRVRLEMNERQQTVNYLENHAAEHTQYVHPLTLLGELDIEAGDLDAAAERYSQAIARDPRNPTGYLRLGDLRAGQQSSEAALAVYLEGLEVLPENGDLLVRAGLMNEQLGNFEQAISLYETALVYSDSIVAKNNLAMLYADRLPSENNLRKALSLMRPYAGSRQTALLDTLGWVYYRLGDGEQAVRYVKAAIDGGGDDIVLRYHLGMAYALAGQPDLARPELLAALESGQDFPGVDEARAKLKTI